MISHNNKGVSLYRNITILLVFLNAEILEAGLIQSENWYSALLIAVPLLLISIHKTKKYSHADSAQAKSGKAKLRWRNTAANNIAGLN